MVAFGLWRLPHNARLLLTRPVEAPRFLRGDVTDSLAQAYVSRPILSRPLGIEDGIGNLQPTTVSRHLP